MAQLVVADTRKEVGLVFYGVDRCCKIDFTVNRAGGGIVSGGSLVKFMAPALFKVSELDHLVAHQVGVGGESAPYGTEGVFHHVVPVFLVKRHHVKRQAIFFGNEPAHLYVLFRRTVA